MRKNSYQRLGVGTRFSFVCRAIVICAFQKEHLHLSLSCFVKEKKDKLTIALLLILMPMWPVGGYLPSPPLFCPLDCLVVKPWMKLFQSPYLRIVRIRNVFERMDRYSTIVQFLR